MVATLLEIQKLQFADKAAAENALLEFLSVASDRSVTGVKINTKPESLNSLNGIVELDSGEKFFFKTHTEENETLTDYYNSNILSDAGYPVLSPVQIEHRPGQQIALYEIVNLPTLFDETKKVEDEWRVTGILSETGKRLVEMQKKLDQEVLICYQNTLDQEARNTSKAPIHQLFDNRISKNGRIDIFYRGKEIELASTRISFDELANKQWKINGVTYKNNLDDMIGSARAMLDANRPAITVIGHGDAHNGNVFVDYDQDKLSYFDPAFAGRHNPFLDLVKPLFHNVFTRWMYFPDQVDDEIEVDFKFYPDQVVVEHNFRLPALRNEYLAAQLTNLVQPLVKFLDERKLLQSDWQEFMHAAMFCCPFLTVNLFAEHNRNGSLAERYTNKIKILGLCMCVEAGSMSSSGHSELSHLFAQI